MTIEEIVSVCFRVDAKVRPKEEVYVVGSVPELGSWYPAEAVVLERSSLDSTQWHATIALPSLGLEEDLSKLVVQYRYFIATRIHGATVKNENAKRCLSMRLWETHIKPRVAIIPHFKGLDVPLDTFGLQGNDIKTDEGWLMGQDELRLRIQPDGVRFWKSKYANLELAVRCTPIDLRYRDMSVDEDSIPDPSEVESHSLQSHTVCWVSTLDHTSGTVEFVEQGENGQRLHPASILIFKAHTAALEFLAFFVSFFSVSPNGEVLEQIGSCYLLPNNFKEGQGSKTVPITSLRHQPIGQLTVDYLVIHPSPPGMFYCNMKESYARYWKKRNPLDVGHRGMGSSYQRFSVVRENTLASLTSASSHGADYVEFDVQLTKDLVPVIYHDFFVCLTLRRKMGSSENLDLLRHDYSRSQNDLRDYELLELPVKDLRLNQLHQLKLNHVTERTDDGELVPQEYDYDHVPEHQPFPMLRQVLDSIDPHVGFNIEIKYPMMDKNGKWECEHFFERNLYIDKILECVMSYAQSRRIVFSSFEPDICTLIKMKQNKYPVLFLTQGNTSKYTHYIDNRANCSDMAVNFAHANKILGVSFHAEDLLRNTSPVQRASDLGLVSFVWGDDLNNPDILKHIKSLGVDGVIYDRISEYKPAGKTNVFLYEKEQRRSVSESSTNSLQATSLATSDTSLNLSDCVNGSLGVRVDPLSPPSTPNSSPEAASIIKTTGQLFSNKTIPHL